MMLNLYVVCEFVLFFDAGVNGLCVCVELVSAVAAVCVCVCVCP